MNKRELTCIGCPLGCAITVTMEDKEITSVVGNTCERGKQYAITEVTAPVRTITTTVKVEGGTLPVVSVKTVGDIPKEAIFPCMEVLRTVCVKAPVKEGDVIVEDICGTGVSVIATKNV